MALKIFLILTYVMALVLSVTTFDSSDADKSHDFVIGERVFGDHLVLKKNVFVHREGIYHRQETFSVPEKHMRITKVIAYDQMTDDTGAYCQRLKGGVDEVNVTLEFTNIDTGKIDFVVELYALSVNQ